MIWEINRLMRRRLVILTQQGMTPLRMYMNSLLILISNKKWIWWSSTSGASSSTSKPSRKSLTPSQSCLNSSLKIWSYEIKTRPIRNNNIELRKQTIIACLIRNTGLEVYLARVVPQSSTCLAHSSSKLMWEDWQTKLTVQPTNS